MVGIKYKYILLFNNMIYTIFSEKKISLFYNTKSKIISLIKNISQNILGDIN